MGKVMHPFKQDMKRSNLAVTSGYRRLHQSLINEERKCVGQKHRTRDISLINLGDRDN